MTCGLAIRGKEEGFQAMYLLPPSPRSPWASPGHQALPFLKASSSMSAWGETMPQVPEPPARLQALWESQAKLPQAPGRVDPAALAPRPVSPRAPAAAVSASLTWTSRVTAKSPWRADAAAAGSGLCPPRLRPRLPRHASRWCGGEGPGPQEQRPPAAPRRTGHLRARGPAPALAAHPGELPAQARPRQLRPISPRPARGRQGRTSPALQTGFPLLPAPEHHGQEGQRPWIGLLCEASPLPGRPAQIQDVVLGTSFTSGSLVD